MNELQISVVMPVYNAANFVRDAVESALAQPEVAEVILVEDGSPYGDLAICEQLAGDYDRVKLFRHPNGENRGAGPSRNLGILKSRCDYIAFLDADDFYLPDRFKTARQVFEAHPDAEGVYEAIGVHFETEVTRQRWTARQGEYLTTVSEPVEPGDLFSVLVAGTHGHFSGDGLVVHRSVFSRCGYFPDLRLHQDTAMWIKIAAVARLYPGSLETPVAMRRAHDANRADQSRSESENIHLRYMMWKTLWAWSIKALPIEKQAQLFDAYVWFMQQKWQAQGTIKRCFRTIAALTPYLARWPKLLRSAYFNRVYFPLFRVDRLIVEKLRSRMGRK
ncbi:MAG: glycosyltransferase family 2 protein [Anaerolineae bacterium]|nr:glycosyltransferase family 2 protein [Anaerolineae bacterium]